MKKITFLLFICGLLSACHTSDDEILPPEEIVDPYDLRLSVFGSIDIKGIDYEFEILEGNGDYVAEVTEKEGGDKEALVTIVENKVKVSLLSNSAGITILDKENQSASITLHSYDQSLTPTGYGLFLENGKEYTMTDVSFGAGTYRVKDVKGNSAEVSVLANDAVRIKGLNPGNSYFKLIDHRGTTARFDVYVTENHDLASPSMVIYGINDQVLNVWIKYDDVGWTLDGENKSPLIEELYLHSKGDMEKKYDILQINTAKEGKGSTSIKLKNNKGSTATIFLNIE